MQNRVRPIAAIVLAFLARVVAARLAAGLGVATLAAVFWCGVSVSAADAAAAALREGDERGARSQRAVQARPIGRTTAGRGAGRPNHARAPTSSRAGRPPRTAAAAPVATAGDGIPQISPQVFSAVVRAAGPERSDRVLLLALAWRESRFDPTAQNTASSARGLMQFTKAAWLEAVRDHGAAHGLASFASTLVTDHRTGQISARDPRLLTQLLALRDDPRLSAALTMACLDAERRGLARALKRPATDVDLYLVHFLGSAGGRQFLRAHARAPSRPASTVVRRTAVAANRNVFVAENGRHLTLREVHAEARRILRLQQRVYDSHIARAEDQVRRAAAAPAP